MAQDDTRGLTVHFMDGTTMRFTASSNSPWAVLERPYLCLETEDSAIIIPMANVKYIETSPKPSSVPEFFLKNVHLVES